MSINVSETQKQFWQQLTQAELVNETLPELQAASQAWYVRVMLGFAGWLAALFLLGFVAIGLEFAMKNAAAAIIMGSLFCAAAFALFRMANDNDFVEQFGLAVSMAGQGMLCIGWYQQFEEHKQFLFIVAFAIEVLLIWVMPNTIHRFLSTMAALLALTLLLREYAAQDIMLGLIAAGVVCLWLSNKTLLKPHMWSPIAYAFTCALLWFEIGRMTPLYSVHWSGNYTWWLHFSWWSGLLVEALVCLATAYLLLKREKIPAKSQSAYIAFAASVLVCIASYFAPGLASAALVLLLGFAVGNRLVFGLGIIGLIGFLSHYYYQMQTSLLYKSAVLAIFGLLLLSMRFVFQRYFQDHDTALNVKKGE